MTKMKKPLALLLCIVMCLSLFPVSAFAADEEPAEDAADEAALAEVLNDAQEEEGECAGNPEDSGNPEDPAVLEPEPVQVMFTGEPEALENLTVTCDGEAVAPAVGSDGSALTVVYWLLPGFYSYSVTDAEGIAVLAEGSFTVQDGSDPLTIETVLSNEIPTAEDLSDPEEPTEGEDEDEAGEKEEDPGEADEGEESEEAEAELFFFGDEELAAFRSRDEGIWLFPVEPCYYDSIIDFNGCRGENPCLFCGENHGFCAAAEHNTRTSGHFGIDIDVPEGTEVLAPADGTVYWVGTDWEHLGYTLVMEHETADGTAYYSVFEHLNGVWVSDPGSRVAAGTVVAYSGRTGEGEPDAYLHFAIYRGETGWGSLIAANPAEELAKIEEFGWISGEGTIGAVLNDPSPFSELMPTAADYSTHPGTVRYTDDPANVSIQIAVLREGSSVMRPSEISPEDLIEPETETETEEEDDYEVQATDSGNKVLLVQTTTPWNESTNSTVLNKLKNAGKLSKVDKKTVNEATSLSSSDLAKYSFVLFANDQNNESYKQYDNFRAKLESYVQNGGVVVFGACDNGWSNGQFEKDLPGGVKKYVEMAENNYIANSSNPIVTGELSDGKALTNSMLYSTYCSHTIFDEASVQRQKEYSVILRSSDSGAPTLVKYRYGNGYVIASGLTWEYGYSTAHPGQYAKNYYDDVMLYALMLSGSTARVYDFPYSEDQPSYSVATTCALYSLAAYRTTERSGNTYVYTDDEITDASKKLLGTLLDEQGFEDVYTYNYDSVGTKIGKTVSKKNDTGEQATTYTIGHRKAMINGTVQDQIIIVFRGTYNAQWYGNFDITGTEYNSEIQFHGSFFTATNDAIGSLKSYINEMSNKGAVAKDKLSFLITGHSRGAATANILGHFLTDQRDGRSTSLPGCKIKSVYDYTFATPNVATYELIHRSASYNNIFNYCFVDDFVPNLPMEAWTWGKYGRTFWSKAVDLWYGNTTFAWSLVNYYGETPTFNSNYTETIADTIIKATGRNNSAISSYYNTIRWMVASETTLYQFIRAGLGSAMQSGWRKLGGGAVLIVGLAARDSYLRALSKNFVVGGVLNPALNYAHQCGTYYNAIRDLYGNSSFKEYDFKQYGYDITPSSVAQSTNYDPSNANSAQVQALHGFATQTQVIGDSTVSNAELLGWTADDPASWNGILWADGSVSEIELGYASVFGELDLSSFSDLVKLDVSYDSLTAINLANCENLQYLCCPGNELEELDVSGCPSLLELDCSGNRLTTLNVSGCPMLRKLDCSSNQLTGLIISDSGNLTELRMDYNYLDLTDVELQSAIGAIGDSGSVYGNQQLASPTGIYSEADKACLLSIANYGNNNELLDWNLDDPSSWEGIEWVADQGIYYLRRVELANLGLEGTAVFDECPQLTALNLTGNLFEELSFNNCPKLEILRCAYNRLEKDTVSADAAEYPELDAIVLPQILNSELLREEDVTALDMLREENALIWEPGEYNRNEKLGWSKEGEEYILRSLDLSESGVTGDLDLRAFKNLTDVCAAGTAIATLTLPAGITEIGSGAFTNCEELQVVTLPTSILHIGDLAFSGCKRLRLVEFTGAIPTFGEDTFLNCRNNLNFAISLEDEDITLYPGASTTLSTNLLPAGNLTWTSSKEEAATVDEAGTVTGTGIGSALITAAADTGVSASWLVSVEDAIVVTLPYEYLITGDELAASVRFENGYEAEESELIWTSSDEEIATVDAGVVSALEAGEVTLRATGPDGVYGEVSIAVYEPCNADWIELYGEDGREVSGLINVDLFNQSDYQLTARTEPEGATRDIIWSSDNDRVASVDETGFVTLHQPGRARISAVVDDEYCAANSISFAVRYVDAASELTAAVSLPKSGLPAGSSAQIKVFGEDKRNSLNPTAFIYSSSDESVMSVDEIGCITALGESGTVTITASIIDDPMERSASVTVKAAPVQTDRILLTPDAGELAELVPPGEEETGETREAYAVCLDEEDVKDGAYRFTVSPTVWNTRGEEIPVGEKTLKYSSTDPKVATVAVKADGSAEVTVKAKSSGACRIQAMSSDAAAITGYVAVYVRNYNPRLGASSVTMDSYSTLNTRVALAGGYENSITDVSFHENYNSKTGTADEMPSETISVTCSNGYLTLMPNRPLANGKISGVLRVGCEDGETFLFPLSVTVKNKIPSVTVKQKGKFNLFYKDSTADISITAKDAMVYDVILSETDSFEGYYEDGIFRLSYADSYGPVDTSAVLSIYAANCRWPVTKGITIQTETRKPAISLSPAVSVLHPDLGEDSITLAVYDKNAKADYPLAEAVVELSGASGNWLELSEDEVGESSFKLNLLSRESGTAEISLLDSNWTAPIVLTTKITVKTGTPSAKAGAKALTLDTAYPDRPAFMTFATDFLNVPISRIEASPTDKKEAALIEAEKITLFCSEGRLYAEFRDMYDLSAKGSYSFSVTPFIPDGDDEIALKTVPVKVTVGTTVPSVSPKQKSLTLNTYYAYSGVEHAWTSLKMDSGRYELSYFVTDDPRFYAYGWDTDLFLSIASDQAVPAGKYTVSVIPWLCDRYTGTILQGTAFRLSVKVYSGGTASAAVKSSGKIDMSDYYSTITWTVTKLDNISGRIGWIELGGEDADLFYYENTGYNAKGQYTVIIRPNRMTNYSTAVVYQLKPLIHMQSGVIAEGPIQKIKLIQSAPKVKTTDISPVIYQASPEKTADYTLTFTSAGMYLGRISISEKTSPELRSVMLLNYSSMDGRSVNVTLRAKDTSALTDGKTYTVWLDVYPTSYTLNAKGTTAALKFKVAT